MKKNNWNKNWLFYKEGCEDQVQHIDLPHDAMILEQRDPKTENGGATGFLRVENTSTRSAFLRKMS